MPVAECQTFVSGAVHSAETAGCNPTPISGGESMESSTRGKTNGPPPTWAPDGGLEDAAGTGVWFVVTSKSDGPGLFALPETREEPRFDRTSFRVKKKIFATMTKDGDEAMVRVLHEWLRRRRCTAHCAVTVAVRGFASCTVTPLDPARTVQAIHAVASAISRSTLT